MGIPVKYCTSQPTRSGLRKGNLIVGTGDENYGPSSTTSYKNTIGIKLGGWSITTLSSSNTPICFQPGDATALIAIAVDLGSSASNEAEAVAFFGTRANTWIFRNFPHNMVTDDLVFDLDAGSLSSYPGTGTVAKD